MWPIVIVLVSLATSTTCTNVSSSKWKKSKGLISPVGIGAAVIVLLLTLLAISVIGWLVIILIKRKSSEDSSRISSSPMDPTITKEQRIAMKKVKKERRFEAALLQTQVWMQQLQVLENVQTSKHPDPDVHGLLKDKVHTLNYIQLKRESARLIGMRRTLRRSENVSLRSLRELQDTEEITAYVHSIADEALEEEEADQDALICRVRGCRLERIAIRADTAVPLSIENDPKHAAGKSLFMRPRIREPRMLHMNRMKDYYGNTLLLCQAPMPGQFADQWQVIWEQRVGVMIWIGSFVELGRPKVDPYIPLEEGESITCGEYKIETLFVVKFENEFNMFRVGVTFELATADEYREIIVIHVHMWPDHRIPDEPAQLADLVAQVQGHQLRQSMQGLPGMLAHCSLGVQRSPAFLAAYIGRQMWMANRLVNPLGIMRYIRRHRWRAFGYGNPFAQVQIIFGVLELVATRHEMEGIGDLNVSADEERIFDENARLADAKQPSSLTDRSKNPG